MARNLNGAISLENYVHVTTSFPFFILLNKCLQADLIRPISHKSAGAPRDTQSKTSQTNSMKTIEYSSSINYRITSQAALIKRAYIKILENGGIPARLSSWIADTRYGILDGVNDRRLNQDKVLHEVKTRAHHMIKGHLQASPLLAQRLADLRAWKAAEIVKMESETNARMIPPPSSKPYESFDFEAAGR